MARQMYELEFLSKAAPHVVAAFFLDIATLFLFFDRATILVATPTFPIATSVPPSLPHQMRLSATSTLSPQSPTSSPRMHTSLLRILPPEVPFSLIETFSHARRTITFFATAAASYATAAVSAITASCLHHHNRNLVCNNSLIHLHHQVVRLGSIVVYPDVRSESLQLCGGLICPCMIGMRRQLLTGYNNWQQGCYCRQWVHVTPNVSQYCT